MDVGKNIRLLRKANGVSQSQLANELFVTPQAVSRWENNITQPDLETLNKMAVLFDTSVDSIVNGDECIVKIVRADRAYHIFCVAGGALAILFAILIITLICLDAQSLLLEAIYIAFSLLFLVILLLLEVRTRKLKKNLIKLKKEKTK